MADPIFVTQGVLVTDTSLVPYIRRQEINFDADNLRPSRRASLFFDEVAINKFCQKGNRATINSRKSITLTTVGTYSAVTTDYAWQGFNYASRTFRGKVVSYATSPSKVLVIDDLTGNFDDDAPIYISDSTGATLKLTATIVSAVTQNSATTFSQDEQIYSGSTNCFMTVIGTSGENIVYLNENFAYCAVIPISPVSSIIPGSYSQGDIVIQTTDGTDDDTKTSFTGYVQLIRQGTSSNVLSITSISGSLKVNSNPSNVWSTIYNRSNSTANPIRATNFVLNSLSSGDYLYSIDTGAALQISKRRHFSGAISNTTMSNPNLTGGSRTIVQLSANCDSSSADDDLPLGQIFYITSGTGIGQMRRIIEVRDNAIKLNSALLTDVTNSTRYSIGPHITDINGGIGGIINIPEEPNFKFKTGERVFTITDTNKVDNPSYTMKASGKFTASGLLNITQRISSTPVNQPLPEYSPNNPVMPPNPTQRSYDSSYQENPTYGSAESFIPKMPLVDGLSQTFFTPKPSTNKVNRGIFVTSVDLFFRRKPSTARGDLQLPVTLKIALVSNGYPTKNYIARCTVAASDVNVAPVNPSVSIERTKTKFTFKDPVYLEPNSEYALTISSESPEYELWVAKLGSDVLNSTPPVRISQQPYAGSLFKSQNASTWEPEQLYDLMFVINKAVFSTSGGEAYFKLDKSPNLNLEFGKALLHGNDLGFAATDLTYGLRSYIKDTVTGTYTQEGSYTTIKPHVYYRYGDIADTNPYDNYDNTRHIKRGAKDSIIIRAAMASTDSDISPIINRESISLVAQEYLINDAELSSADIAIANRGVGYKTQNSSGNVVYGSSSDSLNTAAQLYRQTYLANNYNIAFYNLSVNSYSTVTQSFIGSGFSGFAVANTTGDNAVDYAVVINGGSGYYETPVITVTDPIDTTSEEEARVLVNGETEKRGGNIKAKYFTREISLLEDFAAEDLIVFMDVIKPAGTDVIAYYKVLGIDDPDKFDEKTWVRMEKKLDLTSRNSKEIVEIQYRPKLLNNKLGYVRDGIEYPIGDKFKSFAVKVCLVSNDKAIVPYIRNIRISAVPGG